MKNLKMKLNGMKKTIKYVFYILAVCVTFYGGYSISKEKARVYFELIEYMEYE